MAEPRRLAILKHVQATLRQARGPEYHYPVTTDESVHVDPTVNLFTMHGVDLPAYVIEPTPDGVKEFLPAEQVREVMALTITGRMDAESADALARMTTWENMAADLEKALQVDLTRNGLAVDTRLGVPQPFVGVGSAIVILVQPLEIRLYRTVLDGS